MRQSAENSGIDGRLVTVGRAHTVTRLLAGSARVAAQSLKEPAALSLTRLMGAGLHSRPSA